MLKRLFTFFVIFVVSLTALAACGGETTTTASWTTSGTLTNIRNDDSWQLSVDRANGHIRRDVTMTQEQLDMLHVWSWNSEGQSRLTLIQGSTEIEIDLTGGAQGFLITSGLEPGSVRMRLDFEGATDIDVEIRWQASGLFFN